MPAGSARRAANREPLRHDGVLLGVCALATAVLLTTAAYTPREWLLVGALAGAIIASETALNDQRTGIPRDSLHPGWAFLTGALVLHPGSWIVAAAVLGSFALMRCARCSCRASVRVALRSAGQCAVAVALVHVLGQSVFVAVAAAAVGALLGAVHLVRGQRAAKGDSAFTSLLTGYYTVLPVAVGAAGAFLLSSSLLWLPAVFLLVAAWIREYTTRSARLCDTALFLTMMAHPPARGQGGVLPAAERTLALMEAAFASPRTDVTVTLLDTPSPWQLSRHQDGALARSPAPLGVRLVAQARRRGVGSVTTASSPSGAMFTAVMGGADGPLAFVTVRWSGGSTHHRRRHNRRGARLAALAGTWLVDAYALEKRESAVGSPLLDDGEACTLVRLSDRTRPALATLQDATRRVTALSREDLSGPGVDIVRELDRAAGALATLMGAVGGLGASSTVTSVDVANSGLRGRGHVPDGVPAHVPFGDLTGARRA